MSLWAFMLSLVVGLVLLFLFVSAVRKPAGSSPLWGSDGGVASPDSSSDCGSGDGGGCDGGGGGGD